MPQLNPLMNFLEGHQIQSSEGRTPFLQQLRRAVWPRSSLQHLTIKANQLKPLVPIRVQFPPQSVILKAVAWL